MNQPLRTSLHPLTFIHSQIQSPNIKEAWTKLIGDKKSPNSMTMSELDGFIRSATHNDSKVPGHDLTAIELADLQMIRREAGPFLFSTDAVGKAYDRRLAPYEAKMQVSISDTDPTVQVSTVALNKVAIKGRATANMCPDNVVCIIGGPTTVSIDVGGQKFAVQPRRDESAQSIARRLEAQLDEAGLKASVTTQGGRAILSVNGTNTLPLQSLTTDRAVNMHVIGSTISISAGIGGPIRFEGGRIGVNIKGQDFLVQTRRGQENIGEAFDQLRKAIIAGGYDVEVNSPPTIDSFLQAWSIKPAQRKTYADNTYAELSGSLGPADSEGNRMFTLDRQIQVGETLVNTISVQNSAKWAEGKATLTGRLDLEKSMLAVFPPQYYAVMSGATNPSAGEPSYDGREFKNAKGQALEQLSYHPAGLFDGVTSIFVLDQSTDKAFQGGIGHNAPPHINPFLGFSKNMAIKAPTRTDIGAVDWHTVNDTPGHPSTGRAREEWPHNRAGEAMVQVGGPETIQGKRWFMDEASRNIYGFQITGPQERSMEHVIKKDPRDV